MSKMKEKKIVDFAKYLKYNKDWEQCPQFQDWLGPLPGNHKSAYCKVCCRPLVPNKKDLEKHARTKKHKLNYARNLSFKEYGLISTDSNLPVSHRGHFIKCETIDGSLLNAEPAASFDQNEKQSITIKLFPSDKGDGENIQFLDEGFSAVSEEEVGLAELMQLPVQSIQSLPQYRDWLLTEEPYASCCVCKAKFKCTHIQIYKHSIGKIHLEKSVNKNVKCSQPVYNSSFDINYVSTFPFHTDIYYGQKISLDLRTDSVALPSDEMKNIMFKGKKVVDEGLVNLKSTELEEKVAMMLKKNEGLIFPSITMANTAAVLTHCWNREAEVIMGDRSQLYLNSFISTVKQSSIHVRTVKNKDDGTFCLKELKNYVSNGPLSSSIFLICIETPLYSIGGKAPPLNWIQEVTQFCVANNCVLHMDGSRLLNASLAYGCTPDNVVQSCDSLTFCLEKGLGASIGSILAGTHPFIKRAKNIKEMLGGSLLQTDMIVVAGLHALQANCSRLAKDHANAKRIAQCIRDLNSSAITVNLEDVQTNVVHLYTDNITFTPTSFCERMAQISDDDIIPDGVGVAILVTVVDNRTVRLVTHNNITTAYVELIINKLLSVIQNYENKSLMEL